MSVDILQEESKPRALEYEFRYRQDNYNKNRTFWPIMKILLLVTKIRKFQFENPSTDRNVI